MSKKKDTTEKEVVNVDLDTKINSEVQVKNKELKTVLTQQIQLSIYTPFFYNRHNKDAKIVVKNEGYGDVYVSTEYKEVVDKADLIITNETKEFDSDVLYFVSYSQPFVLLKEVI